jgi:hypothetical protein
MTDCTCPPEEQLITITCETRRSAEASPTGRYIVYPEDFFDAETVDITVGCLVCGTTRQLSIDEWEMSRDSSRRHPTVQPQISYIEADIDSQTGSSAASSTCPRRAAPGAHELLLTAPTRSRKWPVARRRPAKSFVVG